MTPGNYTLKQRNFFILGIIIILAVLISIGLRVVTNGLLGGIIIYVIFRPLNVYLQEKKHWNKAIVTVLILIISFVCLVLPFFFLIKMIVDRVTYYIDNPDDIQNILANINKFAADKLNEPNLINDIIAKIKLGAGDVASSIINGAASTFIQLVVMYFVLYFLIRNFRQFEENLIKYLPFRPSNSRRMGSELRNMTYSNVLGQGFIAIVQGTLLGIGFWLFGIANPVFWGVVGIFLSMIPMFGSPLIFMPAGIIELSNGHTFSGVGVIVYGYVLITTIDNVIRMLLGRRIANVHPVITVIGVVIGLKLFGILGILYGPLILSLFFILIEIYESNRSEIARQEGYEEEET